MPSGCVAASTRKGSLTHSGIPVLTALRCTHEPTNQLFKESKGKLNVTQTCHLQGKCLTVRCGSMREPPHSLHVICDVCSYSSSLNGRRTSKRNAVEQPPCGTFPGMPSRPLNYRYRRNLGTLPRWPLFRYLRHPSHRGRVRTEKAKR